MAACSSLAAYRSRIRAHDGAVRAYVHVREEEAAERAPGGPLGGAAIAVKASLAVHGMPTTSGSRALANRAAPRDCELVARLRAAGADILGQTNMDEFGIGIRTSNQLHGATTNPWSARHSPGGSSGGSAAAVAARMCDAAIGVDTAGSVRIPATLCGVTAVMPCEGVLPRDEDSACGTRFDRLGVMARSIEECAAVLDAVANGTSFATRMSHPLDGVRVGIATRYLAGASPGVVKNVVRSARTLRALGAAVGRSALPRIDVRPMLQVLAWERRRALRALLDSSADLLEPATLTYLRDAERVTDADYETSVARCDEARAALDAAMDPFDIVLLPTTPLAAPVTGAAPRSLLSNTFAFNVSRQPAVTVPNGFVAGLPTGTMLVGRHGSTDLLLRAAYALQQASKYHLATPSTPDGDLP